MLSYVSLTNQDYGVSVLTNSTREYEIIGDDFDTIAITLFRGVGFLGKEEMLRRPGRPSGIKLPTPDSQMIGEITMDFALATHTGEANVARLAKEYVTPVETYNKIPHDAMKLNHSEIKTPLAYSLMKEVEPSVVMSTLKKAEKDDKLILRFYNSSNEEKQAAFKLPRETAYAAVTNLNEDVQKELEVDSNRVLVHVKENQVKSIMF
jgi:mannosylglycerate hydrolase